MALCRQGSESLQDWNNSSGATFRAHDHYSTRHGESGSCSNRTPMKCYRGKKFGRVAKSRQCSIGVLVVIFFGLVGLTLLGSNYRVGDKGETVLSEDTEFFDNQQGHSTHYSFQNSKAQDYSSAANQNNRKEGNNEILERSRRHGHALVYGSGSRTSKVLGFGQGSTGSGQDSRYWDRDDRRRDEEYDEENFQISNTDFKSGFRQNNIGWHKRKKSITESDFTSHVRDGVKEDKQGKNNKGARHSVDHERDNMSTGNPNGQEFENGGLYNERGRNELKIYEAQYLADLKEELGLSGTGRGDNVDGSDGAGYIKGGDVIKHPSIERGYDKSLQVRDHEQIDADDEYDDGIDEEDIHAAEVDSVINRQGIQGVPGMPKEHTQGYDRKDLLETQGNLPKENPGYVKEKQMLEIGNYFDGGSSLHKYHGQGYDRKDLLETQSHLSKDTQVYDRKGLLETQGNLPKENPGYAKEKQMLEIGNDFDRGSSLHKYHGQGYDRKDLLETQSHLSKEQLGAGKWKEKPENAIKSDFDNELSLFIHGFQEDSAKETSKLENASLKVDTGKRNTYLSKSKHRKRASAPCEIGFLNSTVGLLEPEENSNFAKFSLQYIESEEKPEGLSVWKPRFAGHQTLVERENSFYAQDQKLHCGFIKGPEGSSSTGFDLAEEDSKFLNTCHIAVSSCIFGNSDNIRTPTGKKVTQFSKKNVCFVMFVDEKTLHTMSSEGREPNEDGYIGLWKVVVVRNLPYTDMRRTGKVPKFLTHRLFPSARYSIWLDSKMRLQSDPLLILEYFLWRGGFEYAISNHYDRHCVWEEVMQNKRLNKFNHTVIDEQFAYYQADGLTKFNASDSNKLLPSHVPEGSFIVRAHTPMSNLFSCLWFNEVDRFTPRDQLSFAYTFLKLTRMNPEKHFFLNMFKDCERRAMAKLFRHRPEETPSSVSSVSKV